MKILLTGANGYIGTRLMPILVQEGHQVIALVRSSSRLSLPKAIESQVEVVEVDLLSQESCENIPKEIDAAYYLVHSMGSRSSSFSSLESQCASNFVSALSNTNARQVIYLSGLSQGDQVSEHMASRGNVDQILRGGTVPVTTLRAGIIVGEGSASFEIIRDLVEKLPVMVAPRWVKSRCQPIGIVDILYYLSHVLFNDACENQTFEVGGPDILTYKEMLLQFAKVRGLKRSIITVPVLTPYLSSLWLYFVTSTNFSIARALVKSMTTDAVCQDNRIHDLFSHQCLNFQETVKRSFSKIEQNAVVSSWKDTMVHSRLSPVLKDYIEVPHFGCLKEVDQQKTKATKREILDRLWKIGGDTGWYTMNFAWSIRGFLDLLFGGVGLRRGRTHKTRLTSGDVVDFWRVISADRKKGHLLLYAEMRLPGEAWLEWKIEEEESMRKVTQTATFRPKGLFGRLYWYMLYPFHKIIFYRLCKKIAKGF